MVGAAHEPFVICELSGNHNGSLERALEMIEAAAATGCDAIKIQTYTADTITMDVDAPAFRIQGGLWDGRTLYELYQEAQTPYEWHAALFERARALGVMLFSSPFDESAVDLLADLGAPAFKIASFEAVDLPLIRYAAGKGKPLIISTGMANLAEIEAARDAALGAGAPGVVLLHCVSSYPAPLEEANVRTVPDMAARFGCPVGLSDHTPGRGGPGAGRGRVRSGQPVEIGRHERAGRQSGPGLIQAEEQAVAHRTVDADPRRQVQLHGPTVDPSPGFGPEGVERTVEQHRLDPSVLVAIDARADAIAAVALIAAVDLGRLRQRLAALERLDDVRIT